MKYFEKILSDAIQMKYKSREPDILLPISLVSSRIVCMKHCGLQQIKQHRRHGVISTRGNGMVRGAA